jgi:ubiquinone/menaquinone biosynthesis C-methylase UbiE
MSWRLMQRGHRAIAVDIFTDPLDGLGAIHRYAQLDAIAADFDQLPFGDARFDVAIYNASLHYSPNYARTLKEARRCLRPDGRIVVIDSPVYRRPEHGERMRSERQSLFEQTYGFRSEALGSIEYLDEPELATLSRNVGIQWNRSRPWYGWRWAMRPVVARLRGKRPPSRFFVISGRLV